MLIFKGGAGNFIMPADWNASGHLIVKKNLGGMVMNPSHQYVI